MNLVSGFHRALVPDWIVAPQRRQRPSNRRGMTRSGMVGAFVRVVVASESSRSHRRASLSEELVPMGFGG